MTRSEDIYLKDGRIPKNGVRKNIRTLVFEGAANFDLVLPEPLVSVTRFLKTKVLPFALFFFSSMLSLITGA